MNVHNRLRSGELYGDITEEKGKNNTLESNCDLGHSKTSLRLKHHTKAAHDLNDRQRTNDTSRHTESVSCAAGALQKCHIWQL